MPATRKNTTSKRKVNKMSYTAHTDRHNLGETPIGQLIDAGKTDYEIAEITGYTSSAANKWRNGGYANSIAQDRAKEYIASHKRQDGSDLPPKPDPLDENVICMISVPPGKMVKVKAVLGMLNIDVVDLDG